MVLQVVPLGHYVPFACPPEPGAGHPEPFAYCHLEPFAYCHPEQSEGSRFSAQGKLREGSRFWAQGKLWERSPNLGKA